MFDLLSRQGPGVIKREPDMFRHARSSLLAASLGALALAPASLAAKPVTQTLTPPPPSFETCKTVGGGSICDGTQTVSYGPVDTGIVCGSGATAFDIIDQGIYNQHAIRYYDQNGNLTRRVIHSNYSFGQWSNPSTGATVNYTQHGVETDVLAIPGDLSSSTQTDTGENIYRTGTGAPVFIATGRQVFNFDGSELLFSAGRNGFIAAFFQGDTAAFDQVCAALAN